MTARLPVPGGDDDTWGDILNDFLEVSLSSTGTLNNNVVGTNQIQNNAVTNAQLDSTTQTAVSKATSSVQSVNSKTPNGSGAVTLAASDVSAIPTSAKGAANGVATLDSNTLLTAAQLPTSVVTTRYVVDTPENHGAKRDGTTDDSAAIIAAFNNAVSEGQANGSNYAEVWFTAGIYQVNGALQQSSSTSGNSQLPLPYISGSTDRFTLVLRGVSDASAVWNPPDVETSRVVIRSNLTTGFSSSFGSASVLGGPTPQQIGFAESSNMTLLLDGLSFITPFDAGIVAIDLQSVSEAGIVTLNLNGSIVPNTFNAAPTSGGVALRMPTYFATNNSYISRLTIIGYSYGLVPGENTMCENVTIFYCQHGVAPQQTVAHAIYFSRLSTQGCTYHISSDLAGGPIRLDIGMWDTEDVTINTTYHLNDPSDFFYGLADWHNYSGRIPHWGNVPIVNGGTNYKIVNYSQVPGKVTSPPSVPAASTNFTNPLWRDAFVQISGGSGVSVTVDGLSFPNTAPIPVRSGGVINLGAYTGSPTWTWYLL